MISFKSFVHAIHDAIFKANDAVVDKNADLLDKYFVEKNVLERDEHNNVVLDTNGQPLQKIVQEPVSVIMNYPIINHAGKLEETEVHVPLITLVPMTVSQIEKATIRADFIMEIVNGDLQLDFGGGGKQKSGGLFGKPSKSRKTKGSLEITIAPQETPEGLKLLIDGYETMIKRQIP
ncbi:MAG: hypothetical protein ACJAY8_000183 [Sphingobacteriales bacterium]|jgi:hypothetical protein